MINFSHAYAMSLVLKLREKKDMVGREENLLN